MVTSKILTLDWPNEKTIGLYSIEKQSYEEINSWERRNDLMNLSKFEKLWAYSLEETQRCIRLTKEGRVTPIHRFIKGLLFNKIQFEMFNYVRPLAIMELSNPEINNIEQGRHEYLEARSVHWASYQRLESRDYKGDYPIEFSWRYCEK